MTDITKEGARVDRDKAIQWTKLGISDYLGGIISDG